MVNACLTQLGRNEIENGPATSSWQVVDAKWKEQRVSCCCSGNSNSSFGVTEGTIRERRGGGKKAQWQGGVCIGEIRLVRSLHSGARTLSYLCLCLPVIIHRRQKSQTTPDISRAIRSLDPLAFPWFQRPRFASWPSPRASIGSTRSLPTFPFPSRSVSRDFLNRVPDSTVHDFPFEGTLARGNRRFYQRWFKQRDVKTEIDRGRTWKCARACVVVYD